MLCCPFTNVCSGSPLYNGPRESININRLKDYYTFMDRIWPGSHRDIGVDVISRTLNLRGFLIVDTNYRLVSCGESQNTALKTHLLDGIECFKYTISNGHRYCYDAYNLISTSSASNEISRNNPKIQDFYNDITIIIKLFHIIDFPEIDDFIIYYFRLFTGIYNKKRFVSFIIDELLFTCMHIMIDANTCILRRMIDVMQQTGFDFNYTLHQCIFRYTNKPPLIGGTNSSLLTIWQIAFSYSFKVNLREIIKFNNLIRCIRNDEDDEDAISYDKPLEFIYNTVELVFSNNNTVASDDIIKILVANNEFDIIDNHIDIIRRDLYTKLTTVYNMNCISKDQFVDLLVDIITKRMDNNTYNLLYDDYTRAMTNDINNIFYKVGNEIARKLQTLDNSRVVGKLKEYGARLAKISFHIPMNDVNLYLYTSLCKNRIRNYDEWFAKHRQIAARANKFKLSVIIRNMVIDSSNVITINNLVSVMDIIASFC